MPAQARRRWLAILAVFLLPSSHAGQQAPIPVFEEKIRVVEVLLDVVVVDSQGYVVLGLGKDDFSVEEGGQEVEVLSVGFRSSLRLVETEEEAREEKLAQVWRRQPEPRYFIVVYHDLRRSDKETFGVQSQQMRAARGLRRWLEEELLPSDYVAVTSYDFKLKVHQDFTRDRAKAVDGINRAVTRHDPGEVWPSRVKQTGPSLTRQLPPGKQLRRQTRSLYDGLKVVAQAARPIRGRKSLLLFSIGYLGDYSEHPLLESRYRPSLLETLNDSNVAIYSIDTTPANAEHALGQVLFEIADRTGGLYFGRVESFVKPLRQVSEVNSGYYELSYQSQYPEGESGYRRVRVRARNPEFRVFGRKGYIYGED